MGFLQVQWLVSKPESRQGAPGTVVIVGGMEEASVKNQVLLKSPTLKWWPGVRQKYQAPRCPGHEPVQVRRSNLLGPLSVWPAGVSFKIKWGRKDQIFE
ncbi:hypothetical protein NPIL_347251 [Nephila pilipes]|uniref:Uncharacterized protein n=1 Tax=Nephila pilipes TaxID=299642 RepID=A0A8X6TUK8_NEPPI|nr:hypothetical protein NPIL_347251 [Nephila pilipes]